MLIKARTKEHDDIFILFGGSGTELSLCKKLNRNFISCELHEEYYKMILDVLKHDGNIQEEYKLLKNNSQFKLLI
jgi:site-specific DNA-methyltransferase (adenine-specific)